MCWTVSHQQWCSSCSNWIKLHEPLWPRTSVRVGPTGLRPVVCLHTCCGRGSTGSWCWVQSVSAAHILVHPLPHRSWAALMSTTHCYVVQPTLRDVWQWQWPTLSQKGRTRRVIAVWRTDTCTPIYVHLTVFCVFTAVHVLSSNVLYGLQYVTGTLQWTVYIWS